MFYHKKKKKPATAGLKRKKNEKTWNWLIARALNVNGIINSNFYYFIVQKREKNKTQYKPIQSNIYRNWNILLFIFIDMIVYLCQ